MADAVNQGAFTVRPPRGSERREFFEIIDLMCEEIKTNRKIHKGPTSKAAIVVEMLTERYAEELKRREREQARLKQDAANRMGVSASDIF